VLEQLLEAYPQDVRLVYREFPLTSIHDKAMYAAQAAQAAGLQGKYFEMHEVLFDAEKWTSWSGMSLADFQAWVETQVAAIKGLDAAKFKTDVSSDAVIKAVNDSLAGATAVGLNSTPSLLVNNLPYGGRMDLESLAGLVEFFKLPERGYTECPPMAVEASKTYTATITTERGDIVIELYADKAPWAVNSFVFLAREGWFDNTPFHRVISGFVAKSGDPSGTGFGGPGYQFGTEISALKFDAPGMVGMARSSDPNSNGSQFFITLAPQPTLDGQYTVFGKVIEGLDVANSLRPRDASTDEILLPGDKILSVTIVEK
jgi:cyclophilin family peptidyl-prolyl cis-trans isomerase